MTVSALTLPHECLHCASNLVPWVHRAMAPDPKEGIMSRAFWFAVLAYLIPTFLLGYFWHLVTLRHHYERLALYRDRVVIPLGLASMVIQAVAFAWLYPRVFSTDRAVWLES